MIRNVNATEEGSNAELLATNRKVSREAMKGR